MLFSKIGISFVTLDKFSLFVRKLLLHCWDQIRGSSNDMSVTRYWSKM